MHDRAPELPAAVLWDMDGTLVDTEKLWDVALYEVAERLGGALAADQRAELVGSNMRATAGYLLRTVSRPVDEAGIAEVSTWIRERTTTLFEDALPWRPGAQQALTTIRAAGIPSALVTSTERELTELALRTIGKHNFDVIVCGDEVGGRNKPHPQPYLRAAELLKVPPGRCVAIEDSPPGAESAVAAGCAVLVVPCDAPVERGPGRSFRDSLLGLDAAALCAL